MNTGIGIVAVKDEEVVKVSLFLTERMEIKRTETLAVCVAIHKCRRMRCSAVIHTDNRVIGNNFVRRIVQNSIEAEMWEAMRTRWVKGFDTRVVWHRRLEAMQREVHKAASEASAGLGERVELDK